MEYGISFPPQIIANNTLGVLKDLPRMSHNHQITMLKFIKNLSMLDRTHDVLQNSNAIEVLTDLLSSSMNSPLFLDISNQVLNTLYNLCRLSKTRQEDAALNGIIPILQKIVKTERPLKEFALPILCDMAHSGKVGRKILWQNKGLQFYISLLADKYWQVTALDAIFIWLQEETARVEQLLLDGSFSRAIVDCFTNPEASPDAFENFLDPLQKMLRLSPPIASTLAHHDLFSRTASKLNTKKAVVRLNLLRIIRSICDASEDQGGASLINTYGLYEAIEKLAETDPAILVREMASELIKSSDTFSHRSFESARLRPGVRRASSSTSIMTPPPQLISSQSMPIAPGTPSHLRSTNGSGYYNDRRSDDIFDSGPIRASTRLLNGSSTPSSSTTPTSASFRPTSRDSNSGDRTRELASGGAWSGSTNSTKSRLPRTSAARLGRLSLATQQPRTSSVNKEENLTPTHTPIHQNGNKASTAGARAGSALNPSRRRRQTSSDVSRSAT
jgi:hypothetical protein